jgi:hypothetical protein
MKKQMTPPWRLGETSDTDAGRRSIQMGGIPGGPILGFTLGQRPERMALRKIEKSLSRTHRRRLKL